RIAAGAQRFGASREPGGVSAGRACRSGFNEVGADEVIDSRVGLGLDALEQVAMPGFEMIDPALDLEAVAAKFSHAEHGEPAVVDQRLHGDFDPVSGSLSMRKHAGGDGVV